MSGVRAAEAKGIKTLSGLVTDFRKRLGPEGPLEAGYLDWMRASPNMRIAVDRAVRSRKPDGKMHNHQSRVPLPTLLKYGRRLHVVDRRITDFHTLLEVCTDRQVKGIGPVTAYDVATRLGAYLDLEPDRVYLHAGVKAGAEALGIVTKGKGWLTVKELPSALRVLTPNECEDFFCVYRDLFPAMRRRSS